MTSHRNIARVRFLHVTSSAYALLFLFFREKHYWCLTNKDSTKTKQMSHRTSSSSRPTNRASSSTRPSSNTRTSTAHKGRDEQPRKVNPFTAEPDSDDEKTTEELITKRKVVKQESLESSRRARVQLEQTSAVAASTLAQLGVQGGKEPLCSTHNEKEQYILTTKYRKAS